MCGFKENIKIFVRKIYYLANILLKFHKYAIKVTCHTLYE
jgi:hypothetical protein